MYQHHEKPTYEMITASISVRFNSSSNPLPASSEYSSGEPATASAIDWADLALFGKRLP